MQANNADTLVLQHWFSALPKQILSLSQIKQYTNLEYP